MLPTSQLFPCGLANPHVPDRLTAGRSFFRSECHALPIMTKKAKAFGGTVSSCALSDPISFLCRLEDSDPNSHPEKPKLAMMEGAKKPKAFNELARKKYWTEKNQKCHDLMVSKKSFLSKCLSVPKGQPRPAHDKWFLRTFGCERSHSRVAEVLLLLSEELGSLGVVGQEEPDQDTNDDGGDALKDETDLLSQLDILAALWSLLTAIASQTDRPFQT